MSTATSKNTGLLVQINSSSNLDNYRLWRLDSDFEQQEPIWIEFANLEELEKSNDPWTQEAIKKCKETSRGEEFEDAYYYDLIYAFNVTKEAGFKFVWMQDVEELYNLNTFPMIGMEKYQIHPSPELHKVL
jgi:hypothetical protein